MIEFKLGEETLYVRPTFTLAERIEAFGAFGPLHTKLATDELSAAQIANLCMIILKDQPSPPDLERVREMMLENGFIETRVAVAKVIQHFWQGNKRMREEAAKRATAEAEKGAAAPGEGDAERTVN